MFKSQMTYLQHAQDHLECAAETAIDRKEFVHEMRNRNGSAIHVFPGLTLVLSVSRET